MTALAHAPHHPPVQRDVRYVGTHDPVVGSQIPLDGASLEFFGMGIRVTGSELPDFTFQFGPHLCGGIAPESATLHINLTPLVGRAAAAGSGASLSLASPPSERSRYSTASGSAGRITSGNGGSGSDLTREMTVARADGVIVLRRSFRGWSNVPPPIPPLAAMADHYSVMPAVVLAKGDRVLAVTGSPGSNKAGIAVALLAHGWRFVSGQLLVTERRTGRTMPFLTPLEFRGAAAEQIHRLGLPKGSWQTRTSVLDGETVQVRPEALGGVVPVRSQGSPAILVRLCDSEDGALRLRETDRVPQTWPADARDGLRHRGSFALQMPGAQAAEEAANCLDSEFAPTTGEERKVIPIKPFLPAPRS